MKTLRTKFVLALGIAMVFLAPALGSAAVTLIQPNGGGTQGFPSHDPLLIQWTVSPPDGTHGVRLALLRNGLELGTIADLAPGTTNFQWTVGVYTGGMAPTGAGYAVRVTLNGVPVSDQSDASFSILPPKPLELKPGNESGPTLQLGPKASVTLHRIPRAELEIVAFSRLPDHVCPGQSYPVTMTVRNNGELTGRFHLCTVGSSQGSCAGGTGGPVHEVSGHMTRTFTLILAPQANYIENGIWHGKAFLGRVESDSAPGTPITIDDGNPQNNPPSGPCSHPVSTAWGGGMGLAAGMPFCDPNVDNHVKIVEIPSNASQCAGRLLKRNIPVGGLR